MMALITALIALLQSAQTPYELRPTESLRSEDVDRVKLASLDSAISPLVSPPLIAMSVRNLNSKADATTIAFGREDFQLADGLRVSRWVSRRVVISDQRLTISYADSDNCPAVADALALAEQLEPPRIELTGIPVGSVEDPSTLREGVPHDPRQYTLKARGYALRTGSPLEMQWTGYATSAFAAWVETSLRALSDCWGEQLSPRRTE